MSQPEMRESPKSATLRAMIAETRQFEDLVAEAADELESIYQERRYEQDTDLLNRMRKALEDQARRRAEAWERTKPKDWDERIYPYPLIKEYPKPGWRK